jgi:uncharacterized membrane protein YvbJ
MAMGQPGQAPTRSCVACGRAIAWDVNVCPYCGHDFRPQMTGMQQPMYGQPMQQQEAVSGGMKILLYILSFLFWPIGIIIGAIYYGKPETKEVGKMCIILAILGVVIWVVCWVVASIIWVMTI